MSVTVFDTSPGKDADEAFNAWRASHRPLGYYLSDSVRHGWVVHRGYCNHTGAADGSDMATHVKVCATAPALLDEWLRAQGRELAHRNVRTAWCRSRRVESQLTARESR